MCGVGCGPLFSLAPAASQIGCTEAGARRPCLEEDLCLPQASISLPGQGCCHWLPVQSLFSSHPEEPTASSAEPAAGRRHGPVLPTPTSSRAPASCPSRSRARPSAHVYSSANFQLPPAELRALRWPTSLWGSGTTGRQRCSAPSWEGRPAALPLPNRASTDSA